MMTDEIEILEKWFKRMSKTILSLFDSIDMRKMTLDQFGRLCINLGNIEKKLLKVQKDD